MYLASKQLSRFFATGTQRPPVRSAETRPAHLAAVLGLQLRQRSQIPSAFFEGQHRPTLPRCLSLAGSKSQSQRLPPRPLILPKPGCPASRSLSFRLPSTTKRRKAGPDTSKGLSEHLLHLKQHFTVTNEGFPLAACLQRASNFSSGKREALARRESISGSRRPNGASVGDTRDKLPWMYHSLYHCVIQSEKSLKISNLTLWR